MEFRKVQIIGGTTYTVSVPKQWAKNAGLRPNEEVMVVPRSTNELSIVLKRKAEKEPMIDVMVDSKTSEEVLKLIVSYYIAGFSRIKVSSRKAEIDSESKSLIAKTTWKLMGLEVINEGKSEITLTSMLNHLALSIPHGLKRMHGLI